ncbi:hypothetical protein ACS8E9_06435 [Pseudomonas neustonica]|uniref:hypothetical protein n=1 Tax=Pseudomonas TaxID=286 RepID=UPI000C90A1F4|nr:hypothetical protein [Pseudomonas sp. 5Ae-yellow]MAB24120.1 hypothetical protein [Pseudomonadales bacterium]MBA6420774.1 hypothetical protein [Pseudomonas sp. 5Ae-yellow]|tara:strand:+ start:2703 stop:3344 length:642 start_codon:yes stop_codon:yes gene_type:complete
MNTPALKRQVELALSQEAKQQRLHAWLAERLPQLHPAIRLEDDGVETLFNFVQAYVEQVPNVLDAAAAVADLASMRSRLLPVLKVAEAFFLQPPDLPAEHQGLLALLDEAYLAHRLVEEVNDRYLAHGGEALIPMDTTKANLIVHQLLGDDFANQLDAAVDAAVAGLFPEDAFSSESFQAYLAQQEGANSAIWHQWPCMSEQLGVDIAWRGAA